MADALAMSAMLDQLVMAGRRTARSDALFVKDHYIDHPAGILCTLAEDDAGRLLGFQSLIRSTEGNPYGTPTGWGIIGTHVSPNAARSGIGTGLFEVTRRAALDAGLAKIEAYIATDNAVALAYYEKMGFKTYRRTETSECKCWSAGDATGA
ncbi:GNAT family N-acetyltransferase [Neorhizobium alkalisoli]|jgi:RimJ/RimL family protein N-acetyltransferase|uniref:Acetyltransferase (GNAT) family protein n=1 Tax=Neorhizobium alkalisoli TaxID=528178 RepID=A0A561Q0U9_9HYPH|nr:GNAT family N-acetyltransferase [Neorhizobium alkalisoli]TWF43982.1 acetyltransferase (GNAT) family protein [Neorhizobium alkalisoli]